MHYLLLMDVMQARHDLEKDLPDPGLGKPRPSSRSMGDLFISTWLNNAAKVAIYKQVHPYSLCA